MKDIPPASSGADPGPVHFSRRFGGGFNNNRTGHHCLTSAMQCVPSVVGKAVTMTSIIAVTESRGNNNKSLKMYFLYPVVFYVYSGSSSKVFLNVSETLQEHACVLLIFRVYFAK